MPFGSEPPWARCCPSTASSTSSSRHQCLSAASPLGPLCSQGNRTLILYPVTNAFRQRALLGPTNAPCSSWRVNSRHQCLSAASPLGPRGGGRCLVGLPPSVTNAFRQRALLGHAGDGYGLHVSLSRVTNAFRQRALLGQAGFRSAVASGIPRHQCLSAASPLGPGVLHGEPRP